MSFYSGSQYEKFMLMNRMTGPYKVVYWGLITCNLIIPQSLVGAEKSAAAHSRCS